MLIDEQIFLKNNSRLNECPGISHSNVEFPIFSGSFGVEVEVTEFSSALKLSSVPSDTCNPGP